MVFSPAGSLWERLSGSLSIKRGAESVEGSAAGGGKRAADANLVSGGGSRLQGGCKACRNEMRIIFHTRCSFSGVCRWRHRSIGFAHHPGAGAWRKEGACRRPRRGSRKGGHGRGGRVGANEGQRRGKGAGEAEEGGLEKMRHLILQIQQSVFQIPWTHTLPPAAVCRV